MLRRTEVIKKSILAFTGLGVLFFYYFNNPETSKTGPSCLLQATTGWQCWGCGGQRAFHYLLHGNFQKAFAFHPFIIPIVALMSIVVLAEILGYSSNFSLLRNKFVALSVLALLVSFTILRNL